MLIFDASIANDLAVFTLLDFLYGSPPTSIRERLRLRKNAMHISNDGFLMKEYFVSAVTPSPIVNAIVDFRKIITQLVFQCGVSSVALT